MPIKQVYGDRAFRGFIHDKDALIYSIIDGSGVRVIKGVERSVRVTGVVIIPPGKILFQERF